jgi:hypothetical protein
LAQRRNEGKIVSTKVFALGESPVAVRAALVWED